MVAMVVRASPRSGSSASWTSATVASLALPQDPHDGELQISEVVGCLYTSMIASSASTTRIVLPGSLLVNGYPKSASGGCDVEDPILAGGDGLELGKSDLEPVLLAVFGVVAEQKASSVASYPPS